MAITKGNKAAPPQAGRRAAGPQPAAGRAAGRPATTDQGFMSLDPNDQVQGGLIDDVDVTFQQLRFTEWDYQGAIPEPVLALCVTFFDPDGQSVEQYYSAGDLSRAQPSADGRRAVLVGASKGLNTNTNAAMLFRSIVDQGFPTDKIREADGDVSVFEGMVAHVIRVAQPKRTGLARQEQAAGREPTVLVVNKIHKLPWETASKTRTAVRPTVAPPSATRTSPSKAAAQAATDGDLQDEAAMVLVQAIEAAGGSIERQRIGPRSFKLLTGNPNRSAILNLITDADFLAQEGLGWEFDADAETVTLSG